MIATALNNWPAERRLPTDEEFAAAGARYAADRTAAKDMSDFWCGLEFAMATYASWTWLKYFFPEESFVPPSFFSDGIKLDCLDDCLHDLGVGLLPPDIDRDAANILRHLPREVTLFSKDKRPPKPPETKPDLSTLAGWKKAHESHGRIWLDATVGEYEWHRCRCGEKFVAPVEK